MKNVVFLSGFEQRQKWDIITGFMRDYCQIIFICGFKNSFAHIKIKINSGYFVSRFAIQIQFEILANKTVSSLRDKKQQYSIF